VEHKKHHPAFDLLMDKAGIQGYLTTEDLLEILPNPDPDRLESLLSSLRQQGVEVVDSESEEPDFLSDGETPDLDPFEDTFELTSGSSLAGDDTIGLYLKEMSRVPLLSIQEELDLAIRIEKGQRAHLELVKLTGRGHASARRKLDAVIEDANLAREHMIKANTRLVVSIAKRYMGNGVNFLDLIQEGNLGLIKAVEKYDYHRGFRFSTYATWWIRQTITRAIADQARTIRVPVHMTDRIRQFYKVSRDLEQKLGRQGTIEEIAADMKLDVRKVQWIMKVSWLPLSLESPVGDEEDSELGNFVEDVVSPTPLQSAYESMLREKLEEVLTSLSPREARVLRLRFGLDDGNPYTLEEVGQKFGLTRERIRQIEGRALRQLRQPRRAHILKEYL
jgi:RNA polymerase primary sigma factor